ncbi:hypothetical protein FRC12_008239 [Ceratobasidium sp. 428]|nr:hypothetical protein FRC12_008239 [Ceratobasidium sp. 428]
MPPLATKHSEFYFDDSLVVIQVEDSLFKVHKRQLMKSETFSDMFSTPSGDIEEGTSPEKPIVLEGMAASDFGCLLKVLYASYFSTDRPKIEESLIVPAFRLANNWNFEDLRTHLLPLAEQTLENDIDKIVLARECDIKQWLVPAHIRLCYRTEPFTTDEVVKLGVHSLLLITRVRDEIFRPVPTWESSMCSGCMGYRVCSINSYCAKCKIGTYYLSPNGSRPDEALVMLKVDQWVENGCVF